MAWFKKKEEHKLQGGVSELPELPDPEEFSLPELPSQNSNKNQEEIPQLPTLPDLKVQSNLQPQVIKQEVIKPPQEMQRSQFEGNLPPIKITPHQQSYPPLRTQSVNEVIPRSKSQIKEPEPVYVRLDKFEATINSFEEIKKKILEVENILRKIKDVKQKEERELEAWEREIQMIKSRIDAIDKTIFEKLD